MKHSLSAMLGAVIIGMTIFTFTVFSQDSDIEKSRAFLSSYGWETEQIPDSSEKVNIPAEFDEIYKNYNIIQNDAGLDLEPYRGTSGTRYTFIVTNYPYDTGETVYADIICINGEPVAGDIMTVSINGFMHSLSANSPISENKI